MSKTIFEMLKAKVAGPVELQFHNPLKARIGNTLTIHDIDYDGLTFFLKEIDEYKRSKESFEVDEVQAPGEPRQYTSEDLFFTDYDCLCRPLAGEDKRIRLRLNPVVNPDKAAGLTHNVILMTQYDDLGYDEGLHKCVQDTTKIFETFVDGELTGRYYRIKNVEAPFTAQVNIITALPDGRVELADVKKKNIDYWDYWRTIKDEAGQEFNEFCFVEMNKDDGWFTIWQGKEIDAQNVTVY